MSRRNPVLFIFFHFLPFGGPRLQTCPVPVRSGSTTPSTAATSPAACTSRGARLSRRSGGAWPPRPTSRAGRNTWTRESTLTCSITAPQKAHGSPRECRLVQAARKGRACRGLAPMLAVGGLHRQEGAAAWADRESVQCDVGGGTSHTHTVRSTVAEGRAPRRQAAHGRAS